MSNAEEERYNQIWAAYDKDGDNKLNKEEFTALYNEVLVSSDKLTGLPDLETSFTAIDVNKDGLLTREELTVFLTPLHKAE
jgi:Ca2+-binding EF-hand superfamily protein